MTTTPKLTRLIRLTLDTLFHIDYDWWSKSDRDLRMYLRSQLCAEHRAMYTGEDREAEEIDWVSPETAEVKRLDGMVLQMRTHCARQPDYINEHTGLVDAAFRIFLINDNQPLSARQLAEQLDRDPETILKTLSGKQIYQGLRPV